MTKDWRAHLRDHPQQFDFGYFTRATTSCGRDNQLVSWLIKQLITGITSSANNHPATYVFDDVPALMPRHRMNKNPSLSLELAMCGASPTGSDHNNT